MFVERKDAQCALCRENLSNGIMIPYKNVYIVTSIVIILTKKIGTCDDTKMR